MMLTDRAPTRAGTWIVLDDNSRLTCRVQDECAELVIFGSVEVALGMTEPQLRECVAVLNNALTRLHETADQP